VTRVPPKYAVAPAWLLYDVRISKAVLLTALRIYGLGWRHRYERTDPVTVEELCRITELERSSLYGHIAQLRHIGVLRYATVGGMIRFELLAVRAPELPGQLRPFGSEDPSEAAPAEPSPDSWTHPVIHDVVSVSDPDPAETKQQQNARASESKKLDGAGGAEDADPALVALLSAHLAPDVAVKLARRFPDQERLERQVAHYQWALRRGRATGPGWLVRAIEADWWVPGDARPAQADDGTSYISGEFAAFIQH